MPDPRQIIEEGWPSNAWMAYMARYIGGLTAKDFVEMSRAGMFCIEYYFLISKYNALEEVFGEEMYTPAKTREAPTGNMPYEFVDGEIRRLIQDAPDEWALPTEDDASEPF